MLWDVMVMFQPRDLACHENHLTPDVKSVGQFDSFQEASQRAFSFVQLTNVIGVRVQYDNSAVVVCKKRLRDTKVVNYSTNETPDEMFGTYLDMGLNDKMDFKNHFITYPLNETLEWLVNTSKMLPLISRFKPVKTIGE